MPRIHFIFPRAAQVLANKVHYDERLPAIILSLQNSEILWKKLELLSSSLPLTGWWQTHHPESPKIIGVDSFWGAKKKMSNQICSKMTNSTWGTQKFTAGGLKEYLRKIFGEHCESFTSHLRVSLGALLRSNPALLLFTLHNNLGPEINKQYPYLSCEHAQIRLKLARFGNLFISIKRYFNFCFN